MKGIVFSEFIEMVEDTFSFDIADTIISKSNLSTDGAYTSVGTYDHKEMLQLVTHLSEETGIEVPVLVKAFGKHLAGRFVELYPVFFQNVNGIFDFLVSIEHHVHVEVLKLYPDAELPTFYTEFENDHILHMTYQSNRPFAPLAEGLILGCIEYFQEEIILRTKDLSDGAGTRMKFILTRPVI